VVFRTCPKIAGSLSLRDCLGAEEKLRIPKLIFNNHIRFMLWSDWLEVPKFYREMVKLYKLGRSYNYQVLEQEQARLKPEFEQLQDELMMARDQEIEQELDRRASPLEKRLQEIQEQLAHKKRALEAIACIDSFFNVLVNSISINATYPATPFQAVLLHEYVNNPTLPMVFIPVALDTFAMGSASALAEERKESVHEVTFNKNLIIEIGATEVTVGQYAEKVIAFLKRHPGRASEIKTTPCISPSKNNQNEAVVCVSWREATLLSEIMSELDPAHDYRLLSEAEWEYAAKAGAQTDFFCSDNLGNYGWHWINANDNAHTVASSTVGANAFGLWDVAGNTWEWVNESSAAIDRLGPDDEHDGYGFRLARVPHQF